MSRYLQELTLFKPGGEFLYLKEVSMFV